MLYYFKKGKNTTETHKKINAVHGEGSVKSGSRSFLVLLTFGQIILCCGAVYALEGV